MSRARDLSRFANNQAISVDSSLNVGINSTSPDAKLDVVGIVSATEFYGDGSNLTGVSSPGLGTALSDDTTSPLNSIYFTNANLSVASTITVNPPASASAAFTQYANIVLQNDADLIVADGDTFIPDILGIGTDVEEPGTLAGGGGKLRVDNITDKAGTGAPNFPNGVVFTGVTTATGGVQVATGATISGSTNTITALTNGSEKLRITSAGNIGVGTDGPGSLVDIASGDLEFSNKANSSAIQTINFSDGTQGRGKIRYLHDGDNLTFHTFSDERLRITSDGKIGIGTDAPNSLTRVAIQMPTAGGAGAITVVNNSQGIGNTNIVLRSIDNNGGNWADAEFRAEGYSFKSGTQERLHITASGQVTKPSNAAFRAQGNTQYANQTSSFDPIYDNEIFDAGGNYNPTNGRFTAPVDGKYFFYFVFLTYPDNDPNYKTLGFKVNGSLDYGYGFTRKQSSSQNSNQVSTFLDLSANDYVNPHIQLPSGTFDIYMVTGHAHFFGYLVS